MNIPKRFKKRAGLAEGLSFLVSTLVGVAVPAAATAGWEQVQKLLATDRAAGDSFGQSIAISGDRAIVGAPWDDDNGFSSGAAYVFRLDGNAWVQEAKLLAADGAPVELFGESVALAGDRALVGAPFDDDNGTRSGSAYAFHFDGSQWVQEAKLLAADGAYEDYFGASVALSGDTALIGRNHYEAFHGAAYVFRFDGYQWLQEAKLTGGIPPTADHFGTSVALSGDRALVGAPFADENGYASGAAYVFRFDGSTWVQEAALGGHQDAFGTSVALSGDRALVGAPFADGNGDRSGAAYVFHFDGSAWVQQAKLLAADGAAFDQFGGSFLVGGPNPAVALVGDTALVGAPFGGNRAPVTFVGYGAAYLFHFDGSAWGQQAKLLADDGVEGDRFGSSVALAGDWAMTGAPYNVASTGAVYVFSRGELTVAIDIKPGNPRNPINPRSKGKIQVTILSTNTAVGEALDFDALQVAPASVRFGPDEAAAVRYRTTDADRDGDTDLLLFFKTHETGIVCGDTEASVSGETFAGQAITGTDAIKTVGCKTRGP